MKDDGLIGRGLENLTGHDEFHRRHLGISPSDEAQMLKALGINSRETLIEQTLPAPLRLTSEPALPESVTEAAALAELAELAGQNEVWRSMIGCGYHDTLTPEPIKRNILENPGWYTAYTPYQAEIAQGRLEALLNFQQMIIDLTGLPVANASLLDEATAAAESVAVCRRASKSKSNRFFVTDKTHPQVLAVMHTRARHAGIELVVGALESLEPESVFGAYFQTPDTEGCLHDHTEIIGQIQACGGRVCVGCDLLSLMLVKSPGEMGADIAIGSAQRFGVPMGFGGPHAAFMSCTEKLVRMLPGRVIGVSTDATGAPALRMALQTREQHIRRDKATSNICTAQALLANMAGFYAVYHGAPGLRRIAMRVNALSRLLAEQLKPHGLTPRHDNWFDTLVFDLGDKADEVWSRAQSKRINLRRLGTPGIGVSLDETTGVNDIADLIEIFSGIALADQTLQQAAADILLEPTSIKPENRRQSDVLTHPVFNRYHSETEFMRYAKRLENRDISLVHSMIPLGSCTMKLNAASEMAPISWPEFAHMHPFAPAAQTRGYALMHEQLGQWLAAITGFSAVSFQPNSGAQGEYAGLMAIRSYLDAQGGHDRQVCLIPASAHGTNPASASMMGMKVVVVACDEAGNIDLTDLRAKVETHRESLAALMVTYPSTHGVFESAIADICAMVHEAGGQVYMDGANLNAQAGLTSPGFIGADVCHLNLHKTFCIPHGGGGPGMGPIAVAAHLAPHLPDHPFVNESAHANTVSAAPYGSALISTISWMYIRMMGGSGIRVASELAILNANYIAARLDPYFPVLYRGVEGRIAHECIIDLRDLKARYGATAEDVAKRLMDYGFHAPTMSFPVTDTLMIEPTESESLPELDRFCDAMISIHGELESIAKGLFDESDNPLKNAPHTAEELAGDWTHPYSREQAAYPLPWVRQAKFWPPVKRVDNVAGDRHLICTCPPVSDYAEVAE